MMVLLFAEKVGEKRIKDDLMANGGVTTVFGVLMGLMCSFFFDCTLRGDSGKE
jgi:hypothetical protein